MKLPVLLVADPHFTANPADEYRWGLFPWLAGELKAENARTLAFLGDLTDAKDYHASELVNRLVNEIDKLRAVVPRIVILKGNHDQLKDGDMFFRFLNKLEGVEVVTQITEDAIGGDCSAVWLPFTKTPAHDWTGRDFSHFDFAFMHQTVKGARASNGQAMEGEALPRINAGKVYSGDIHVPQVVAEVEYVGSPYHVHFGDSFKPRVLCIDRNRQPVDLHFGTISRITLDIDRREQLIGRQFGKGDQVKVRVHLPQSEVHTWREWREFVMAQVTKNAVLCGLELVVQKSRRRISGAGTPTMRSNTAEELMYKFVAADELGGDLYQTGLDIINHGVTP